MPEDIIVMVSSYHWSSQHGESSVLIFTARTITKDGMELKPNDGNLWYHIFRSSDWMILSVIAFNWLCKSVCHALYMIYIFRT